MYSCFFLGHGLLSAKLPNQGHGLLSAKLFNQGHGLLSVKLFNQSHGLLSAKLFNQGHGLLSAKLFNHWFSKNRLILSIKDLGSYFDKKYYICVVIPKMSNLNHVRQKYIPQCYTKYHYVQTTHSLFPILMQSTCFTFLCMFLLKIERQFFFQHRNIYFVYSNNHFYCMCWLICVTLIYNKNIDIKFSAHDAFLE